MNDLTIKPFLKLDVKPYLPRTQHPRLSYEYPGLPNRDEYSEETRRIKTVSRWSRHIPKVIAGLVAIWGAYSIKVWVFPDEEAAESHDLLSPRQFHPFIVSHKLQIDDDHWLIELVPKYRHWQYSYALDYTKKLIWNGDRIWLVEVKQPDIMVSRRYTPLPLYFQKSEYTRSGEREPLLRVIDNDREDCDKNGAMCLYVKRYHDGEVSRYLTDKTVGDEVELRGPNVEYRFPFHPLHPLYLRPIFRDLPSKVESEQFRGSLERQHNLSPYHNLNFFAAGTGIAPALQVLLSRNPYRGHIYLHYSAKTDLELGPIRRLLFFLTKLDRITFYPHYDGVAPLRNNDIDAPVALSHSMRLAGAPTKLSLKERLSAMEDTSSEKEQVPVTRLPRYANALEQALVTSQQPKAPASLLLVCGPDGYVAHVAGPKPRDVIEQGPVAGLLGQQKWDSTNVYKL